MKSANIFFGTLIITAFTFTFGYEIKASLIHKILTTAKLDFDFPKKTKTLKPDYIDIERSNHISARIRSQRKNRGWIKYYKSRIQWTGKSLAKLIGVGETTTCTRYRRSALVRDARLKLLYHLSAGKSWQEYIKGRQKEDDSKILSITLSRNKTPWTLKSARQMLADLLYEGNKMFCDGRLQISEDIKRATLNVRVRKPIDDC